MKRLTERLSNGQAAVFGCGNNCEYDYKYCNNHLEDCPTINKIYEKLARYEDLQEQGKLLKLPCTVGDTVYVIPSKSNYRLNIINGMREHNRVYKQVVDHIEIFPTGYLLSTCDGMASVSEQFFNKTWFLTQKQAEAALKKMAHQMGN